MKTLLSLVTIEVFVVVDSLCLYYYCFILRLVLCSFSGHWRSCWLPSWFSWGIFSSKCTGVLFWLGENRLNSCYLSTALLPMMSDIILESIPWFVQWSGRWDSLGRTPNIIKNQTWYFWVSVVPLLVANLEENLTSNDLLLPQQIDLPEELGFEDEKGLKSQIIWKRHFIRGKIKRLRRTNYRGFRLSNSAADYKFPLNFVIYNFLPHPTINNTVAKFFDPL